MSSISWVKLLYFSSSYFFFLYITITLIFPVAFARRHNSPKRPPLVMKLTHHHATTSPLYDPKQSIKDLADFDLTTSILRRASYLTGRNNNATTALLHQPNFIASKMVPWQRGGFLVNIQVGSQNLSQYVFMDTGSSLLWINCGYDAAAPRSRFHPVESSSYQTENCVGVDACLTPPGEVNLTCKVYGDPDEQQDACTYDLTYGDGTTGDGEFGRETFRFAGGSPSTPPPLDFVLFGCSHHTNLDGGNVSGVLGLGNNSLSLLGQKGYTKFSYCIGNISDRSYPHHKLMIWEGLTIVPPTQTPISVEDHDRYYVNLVGITIGDAKLDFDPQILARNRWNNTGGMVVDSGSTYSFIPQAVYDKFEGVVRGLITGAQRNESIGYGGKPWLCYNGDLRRGLELFPTVRFEFEGGATLDLIGENVFHQVSDESFCLGLLPVEQHFPVSSTVSIMGNLMQQYLYVLFDLDKSIFAWKDRIDCSLISY